MIVSFALTWDSQSKSQRAECPMEAPTIDFSVINSDLVTTDASRFTILVYNFINSAQITGVFNHLYNSSKRNPVLDIYHRDQLHL